MDFIAILYKIVLTAIFIYIGYTDYVFTKIKNNIVLLLLGLGIVSGFIWSKNIALSFMIAFALAIVIFIIHYIAYRSKKLVVET